MCIRDRFDTFLASHIDKFGHPGSGITSLSLTIAENFLFIIAKAVTDEIISELKKTKSFFLIVDT